MTVGAAGIRAPHKYFCIRYMHTEILELHLHERVFEVVLSDSDHLTLHSRSWLYARGVLN